MLHLKQAVLGLCALFIAIEALPVLNGEVAKRWWTDEIDLGYSVVQGFKQNGLNNYLGVRYATAERFQAPHVPETNRTLYTALDQPPQCYQAGIRGVPTPLAGSEDCLRLNIVAPESAHPGSQYPVLVWIHGGGYHFGNISANDFTGLASASNNAGKPIIIVSIQYRLGAFGFLPGQQVYDNGVLNAGLLDQEYALQWIQRHIYYFGGDTSHVTIWGESAGAGSVMNQVLAHGGNTVHALGLDQPLFTAAILSSNFAPAQYDYNAPESESLYSQVTQASGCGSNGTLACLAALPATELVKTAGAVATNQTYGVFVYVPVTDGSFLTGLYSDSISAGKYNTKNVLSLNNYNEGFIFTDPSLMSVNTNQTDAELDATLNSYIQAVLPNLSAGQRQSILQEYPVSDFPRVNNTFLRAETINGLAIFVCPGYNMAKGVASTAWYGQYVAGDSLHAADLAVYAQANLTAAASQSLVNSFDGAILSFALNGNPNSNPLDASVNPYWPTISSSQVLVFNTTTGGVFGPAAPALTPVNTPIAPDFSKGRVDQCSFWLGPIAASVPN